MTVAARVRAWRDEEGDATALGALRVVVGALLLAGALRAERELTLGYFGDAFHWPILPEALVASRTTYGALVVAQALLAALVVVGRGARPALALSGILGLYVLLCDRLEFHHNRYALDLVALLLALAPCDRAWALGRTGPATGPLWAARLLGAQICLVYLASGGSKLLDADWRSGQVLLERFSLYGGEAARAGVPAGLLALLARPAVAGALAKLAIGTELSLPMALASRRLRPFALWVGVWFHVVIEATTRVEGFSWLMVACYAVFATPDGRARAVRVDGSRAAGRALGRAVRALDWLGRFDVRTTQRGPEDHVPLLAVTDRDGVPRTGGRAAAALSRGLPFIFPLWVPLGLVFGR